MSIGTDAVTGAPADVAAACAVKHLSKHYGGVTALDDVSLDFHAGRVHAIVGENGAGKSTLMKIVAGALRADTGQLLRRGRSISPTSVASANAEGIAIVFQELSLFPALDVLANLFSLREPRRFGLVSRAAMRRQASTVLEEVGLDVDVTRPVGELTLAEQQLVEIAKGLIANSEVLILDEPNSALDASESERLFSLVRRLRDRGVAVLYVSQRLEEVLRISDVITVMRNGCAVTTLVTRQTTMRRVVEEMIGRVPADPVPVRSENTATTPTDDDVLTLSQISSPGALTSVDLVAAPGKVVGVAGLEGSGASELLEVVFGLRSISSGTIRLPGGGRPRSPVEAVRAGVAYVPADRRTRGLMLEQSTLVNLCHVSTGVLGRAGLLPSRRDLTVVASQTVDRLRIKIPSLDAPTHALSGGNQQKVVLGKWLQARPRVMLLHDPTRGVDVGSKDAIHGLVRELAEAGCVVLFTTSELIEYPLLCDSVLIFYRGTLAGEIRGDEMTEHNLLQAVNTGEMPDRTSM